MRIFIFICALLSFSFTAMAQETLEKLTKKDVEQFILRTTAVSSGTLSSMDSTQVLDYMRLHIRDDAQFKSAMSYSMPGQEEQDNELTLTKEDFIAGLEAGTQKLKSFNTDIKIKKIKLSGDKRSAKAITETRDEVTMPVEEGDIMENIPLEGISTCEQSLELNEIGILQMTGANCKTKIEFQPY